MRHPTAEHARLSASASAADDWKKWGPYLSERQWGTVREDYSEYGTAWEYFPHDHARSRAYRWGEDGIAGFSDRRQRLCLSLALWNSRDPILKERMFGLTNSEGNHGEDVKELYYYLDATPSHSYLKMLYKYPQEAFPYGKLVEESRRRGKAAPEYELYDTGVFNADRYFDVVVQYAQAAPDDILMRVMVANRGAEAAPIHLLPQLWFRNTWSWRPTAERPRLAGVAPTRIEASHSSLGTYFLYADGAPVDALFCENETNPLRHWNDVNAKGFWKDAFHERVIHGRADAVNPSRVGSKCALWYVFDVPPAGFVTLQLRLCNRELQRPFGEFSRILSTRERECDEYYAHLQREIGNGDARLVQRQAYAGMIWSKQFFNFDVPEWLRGDAAQPPPPARRRHGRNCDWEHLNNADIISMPDKWEYPWYAAWDLAFHCIALAHLDAQFAKGQLILLTREWYMHPNGQMPAYEWAFGDVNPPVHAWATWRVFQIDRKHAGTADLAFLEQVFHKLMLNFTWWVNRKDAEGRNVFQGGFLGLDNIGVFDRSSQLPTGGHIDQADGTSWMAMYALNLMRMALELAKHNRVYEDVATKFFEHFLRIAGAMTRIGGDEAGMGLWDEADEFYYDVLHLPDGTLQPLKVRSMVGLIPLFAVETLEPELLEGVPEFKRRLEWFLAYRPELAQLVSHWSVAGRGQRRLLSLLRGHRMKRLLKRMLDETEFLSPFGVRALSRAHASFPFVYRYNGMDLAVRYEPAESNCSVFGGNSNWRGPIWMPLNFLIIESLQKFHHYYGDEFRVECPTGSGRYLSLNDVANELAARLTGIFLRDASGQRPVFGQQPLWQNDPHFRDHLLFYECFDGDSGRGVGAAHQTGWTGLIAKLLMPRYAGAVTGKNGDSGSGNSGREGRRRPRTTSGAPRGGDPVR
jgi:hypothetical protein